MNETKVFPQALLFSPARRQQLIEAGWWVSIPLNIVSSHWLYTGEQRLDGGYYTHEVAAAFRKIKDSGFEIDSLENLTSEIYILGRFRRVYAEKEENGWPYLSASEVLDFHPTSDRWLAQDHAPSNAERHFARSGWILMTASGTVGRLALTTPRLEKFFLSHDLIRIIPKQTLPVGYLYAYLSSSIGQALISKDQYGAAIKHLEPHHISSLPVPLLAENQREAINEEIMRVCALRDEANTLLDEADHLLHRELGLPCFDESLVPYLAAPTRLSVRSDRPEMPHPKAFTLHSLELNDRLDASFHVPTATTAIRLLWQCKYPPVRLDTMSKDIFVAPRFKRNYVSKEYGVPFLQGSHLPQLKPYDLKYLSRSRQKNLAQWIIREGWILITCSGTIGRIGLVSSSQDGWAASQHLLRIVPEDEKGYPGYIAAFLTTPYGQHQLSAKIYGAVVDELTAEDARNIWIPNAPKELQAKISDMVVIAYEMKAEANEIESNTIHKLEMAFDHSSLQ